MEVVKKKNDATYLEDIIDARKPMWLIDLFEITKEKEFINK